MSKLSDIAKSVGSGMMDTLRGVRDALPEIAQRVEIDAAREAVRLGEPLEQAIQGNGERKKELAMFLLSLFLSQSAMTTWGGLISLVVDIGVAALKRAGKIRKPTAEDLKDVAAEPVTIA